tara:strand:+ start:3755 stop:4678 length:924 start_codon:yes stop_codon:yes gene_type:complete
MKITESELKNMIRKRLREAAGNPEREAEGESLIKTRQMPGYSSLPKWRQKVAKFLSGDAGQGFIRGLADGAYGDSLAQMLSGLSQDKGPQQIQGWIEMFDKLIEQLTDARDKLKGKKSSEEVDAIKEEKEESEEGEDSKDDKSGKDIDDKLDAAGSGDVGNIIAILDELIESFQKFRDNLENQLQQLKKMIGSGGGESSDKSKPEDSEKEDEKEDDEPLDVDPEDIVSDEPSGGSPPPLPAGAAGDVSPLAASGALDDWWSGSGWPEDDDEEEKEEDWTSDDSESRVWESRKRTNILVWKNPKDLIS